MSPARASSSCSERSWSRALANTSVSIRGLESSLTSGSVAPAEDVAGLGIPVVQPVHDAGTERRLASVADGVIEVDAIEEPAGEGDALSAEVRAVPDKRQGAELDSWRGEVKAIAVVAAGGLAAGVATVAALSVVNMTIIINATICTIEISINEVLRKTASPRRPPPMKSFSPIAKAIPAAACDPGFAMNICIHPNKKLDNRP